MTNDRYHYDSGFADGRRVTTERYAGLVEAARAALADLKPSCYDNCNGSDFWFCLSCESQASTAVDIAHAPDCAWDRLRRELEVEDTPLPPPAE